MADIKGKSREEIIREDIKTLHGLGYAQQLFREMGAASPTSPSRSRSSPSSPGRSSCTATA